MKNVIVAGVAALALVACGAKEEAVVPSEEKPATETVVETEAAAPVEEVPVEAAPVEPGVATEVKAAE